MVRVKYRLSSFKIYRARASLRYGNIGTNVIVPELEILNIFEWKNLRMISIQCQEPYDAEARYSPTGNSLISLSFVHLASEELFKDVYDFNKQERNLPRGLAALRYILGSPELVGEYLANVLVEVQIKNPVKPLRTMTKLNN